MRLFKTICFIGLSVPAFAQQSPENPYGGPPRFTDSLQLQVGVTGTAASKEYLPLWLTAKRFGTISDRKSDLSSHILLRNRHALNAAGLPVSFVELSAPFGHDSFLLDVPALDRVVKGFLNQ